MIAITPKPPYYAVIFSSIRTTDAPDYEIMAERMMKLAKQQNGFLSVESARNELDITVSYWKDLKSIKNWRSNTEHTIAQNLGRERWYRHYKIRIALIESDYNFEQSKPKLQLTFNTLLYPILEQSFNQTQVRTNENTPYFRLAFR